MALRLTCPRGHQWDSADGPTRSHDTQRVCPQCGAAPVAQPAASDATLPQNVPLAIPARAPRPAVAGYEILDELGRGGMGVVYKARHVALKRLVALKMVLSGADADPRELARFRAEAEAVARLQHPNIVQIYEVGEHEGRPYCALEFVAGGSLAQQLGGKPLPLTAIPPLMAALAEGVHHAHEAGIIHRDLKPANILLQTTEYTENTEKGGKTLRAGLSSVPSVFSVVKITDFGLAKQVDDPSGQTRSGTILGTPSYMAPEQALGKVHSITPATDVWALGAILYECLTGRPPFRAESSLDTMLQVASQEPVTPTKINPQVPRDLETICLKCLRKEPGKRYASARAFGEDMQRFLRGEPILARPLRPWERVVMTVKRRPALSTAALLVLVFSTMLSIIVWQAHTRTAAAPQGPERNEGQAGPQERPPSEAEAKERFTRYALLIAEADRESLANNFHLANQALDKCPAELRGWEWDYLRRLCNWGVRRTLTGFEGGVLRIAFAKDRLAVVTAKTPGVTLWDPSSGRLLATLGDKQGRVNAVAFSPDGKRLAAAGEDKSLYVYDVSSGKEVYHRPYGVPLWCVAYNPKGDVLAAGGGAGMQPGELRFWKADTGDALGEVRGLKGRIDNVAFDAAGTWINTTGPEGLASFGVPNGQPFGEFPGTVGKYRRVLFDPTASRIAVLPYPAPFRVESGVVPVRNWVPECVDDAGGAILNVGGQFLTSGDARVGNSMNDAAFSPDGKVIAMAGGWPTQGKVRFWRGPEHKEGVTLLGHGKPADCLAFAPDGQSVATGSKDGTVRIWDPTVRAYYGVLPSKRLEGGPGFLASSRGWPDMAFSPDGRRLVTLEADPKIAALIWDLHTGQQVVCERRDIGQFKSYLSVCFSADGRSLAVLQEMFNKPFGNRMLCVWNTANGQVEYAAAEEGFKFGTGDLSPAASGGIFLASAGAFGNDRGLRLYDRGGKVVRSLDNEGMWLPIPALSPDGRRLAAISATGSKLVLWDTATGKELLSQQGFMGKARFSTGGRYLEFHDQNKKTVTLWDAATGRPVELRLPPQPWQESARFSADGKHLALPVTDNNVLIWDVIEGKKLATVRGHGTPVTDIIFSPDGRRLFTASGSDAAVKVWDTVTGQELLSMRHARGGVDILALSPDGRKLATRGSEGTRVWDATPLPDGVVPK